MNDKLSISILLSTYNGEKYIREQIESLLNQSYTNYHIYIRDDGSSDSTKKILNSYELNERITIVDDNDVNLGPAKSFFKLIKYASSDVYMFCDQDDVWSLDKLSIMASNFVNEGIDEPLLIHSGLNLVDKNGLDLGDNFNNRQGIRLEKAYRLNQLVVQNCFVGCSVAFNQELLCVSRFEQLDIDTYFVYMHDWWFGLNAVLFGKVLFIPDLLVNYRQHDNNVVGTRKKVKYSKVISIDYLAEKTRKFTLYLDAILRQQSDFYILNRDRLNDSESVFFNMHNLMKPPGFKLICFIFSKKITFGSVRMNFLFRSLCLFFAFKGITLKRLK